MDNEPQLINGFLKYYFLFLRMAEDAVERIVQQEVDPRKAITFLDIQTSLKLRFSIQNFPKTRIATDNSTLIQSVTKNRTGCLVRLSNLVIVEAIAAGSFAKKRLFRGNCACARNQVKCIKADLIDYVKAADDLAKAAPSLYTPKCGTCATEYNKGLANDVFESYQLVKVQPFGCQKDYFVAYLQCDDPKDAEVGRILEGLFYLDSVTKLSLKQGRLVGENARVLVGVSLVKRAVLEVCDSRPQQSALYIAKEKKNYLARNSALKGKERLANGVYTSAKNIEILLKNIRSSQIPATFDLSVLVSLIWHVHGCSEGVGTFLTSSLPELSKLSSKELLETKVVGSKMNLLVFSQNSPKLAERIGELSRGMVNVAYMPAVVDEESLRRWLISHSGAVLVLQHLRCLKPALRSVLVTAIEAGVVLLRDEGSVALDCSFIVLEHARDLQAPSKAPEFQSAAFINSFDMTIEVQENFEVTASEVLALYGGPGQRNFNYCIASRSSGTEVASRLSGLSKLTYFCKKFTAPADKNGVLEEVDKETECAKKMSLGFLAQFCQLNKSPPKVVLSFKKIALSVRMIEAFIEDDPSLLASVLLAEARGRFEVGPAAAVLAAALLESSAGLRLAAWRSALDRLPLQFATALDAAVAGHPSLAAPVGRSGCPSEALAWEELVDRLREVMFSSMDYYL